MTSETELRDPELARPETERETETDFDEDDRLRPDFVRAVLDAVEAGDFEEARARVEPLHPADIADLIELTPAEDRAALASAIADRIDGDVLAEMNDWVRDALVDALEPRQIADIAAELDTDDAVAIIEDLDADDQREVLRALDPDDRAAIEEALSYPEESAGRLMQREVMAAPQFWSVGDTIDHIRKQGDDLPELFFDIYVVDPLNRPVGGVPISGLLRAPRSAALSDLMEPINEIAVDQDQEEVAYIFEKYHLISAPVVDAAGRLVGQITVDDIVNIIQEENREDILRLAGVSDEDRGSSVTEIVRGRVPWLAINLATAALGASVIGLFEGTIQQIVALAVLMPIVSAIGGNAGTQALTVTVRALATRELNSANATRTFFRELVVGLANGLILAPLIGVAAGIWFRDEDWKIGVVIAAAMILNLLVAACIGVLTPLTLSKLKFDPAVSSAVFVTATTDFFGFLIFLGLATIVLL
ncbi:MAG TPA: magnesium transporter [Sphingomonas bacterium]|uniref:Magnesium transporter MgtE n=1 Tax=Sphingomonas bacterium TaxID=1895847 RepID=A0A3D0WE59_9SPHN|nr:magnesium transporter [Sphingomonas bacterium]